jgi:hypothetical protein
MGRQPAVCFSFHSRRRLGLEPSIPVDTQHDHRGDDRPVSHRHAQAEIRRGQIGVGVDAFRYCRDNGAADRNPRLVGIRLQGQLEAANSAMRFTPQVRIYRMWLDRRYHPDARGVRRFYLVGLEAHRLLRLIS